MYVYICIYRLLTSVVIDVLQHRVSLQTLAKNIIPPLEEKTPFLAIIMFRFCPLVFGSEDDGTLRYSSTTGLGRLERELLREYFLLRGAEVFNDPVNLVWIFTLGSEHPVFMSGLSPLCTHKHVETPETTNQLIKWKRFRVIRERHKKSRMGVDLAWLDDSLFEQR